MGALALGKPTDTLGGKNLYVSDHMAYSGASANLSGCARFLDNFGIFTWIFPALVRMRLALYLTNSPRRIWTREFPWEMRWR